VAVTANSGTNPLATTIIRYIMSEQPEVQQVPAGPAPDKGVLALECMGLAIAPDEQTVYVAGWQENKVYLFEVNTSAKKDTIDYSFTTEDIDYSYGHIDDM
jgi:hypothetical protein